MKTGSDYKRRRPIYKAFFVALRKKLLINGLFVGFLNTDWYKVTDFEGFSF